MPGHTKKIRNTLRDFIRICTYHMTPYPPKNTLFNDLALLWLRHTPGTSSAIGLRPIRVASLCFGEFPELTVYAKIFCHFAPAKLLSLF
jgi:hypothetical protein